MILFTHERTRILSLLIVAALLLPVGTFTLGQVTTLYRGSPVYHCDVINSYPHDYTAYTQGLVIHDGQLFEGTGRYGKSSLRKVDLETGEVLNKIDLTSNRFGEGIAIFNSRIYQLTWRAGEAYVYDLDSFERIGQFHYSGEGWGITHDGEHLITSDGSANLTIRDPETFSVESTIPVWDTNGSVNGLNELEYIDGFIYANLYPTDLIARIDPISGEVKAWLYLEGLLDAESPDGRAEVLNGIAYDSATGKMYLTGKYWPRLYEVEIIE
ncbi:MAG TPA: glutaminyl-peptide cyclotransferase [Bacteroidetes bacterium]|nr:glutamine cyclotransferase [bacterium BMS3Bbin04]HDO65890.1 glutaminyl-peptide cyclotransferase [Bacteroidota bacterium]HEX05015.1 glutaminyl-peptide cyclotransferase [Bacteroidota bacterium]